MFLDNVPGRDPAAGGDVPRVTGGLFEQMHILSMGMSTSQIRLNPCSRKRTHSIPGCQRATGEASREVVVKRMTISKSRVPGQPLANACVGHLKELRPALTSVTMPVPPRKRTGVSPDAPTRSLSLRPFSCLQWTTGSPKAHVVRSSRTTLTFSVRAASEKGFSRNWTPASSTPWWAIALAV